MNALLVLAVTLSQSQPVVTPPEPRFDPDGAYAVPAAIILSACVNTPELTPSPDQWPGLSDALRTLAVEREWLDSREAAYTLRRPDSYAADLTLIRSRRDELVTAPPMAAGHSLPPPAELRRQVALNRGYRKHLEKRMELELDRLPLLQAAAADVDARYQILDAAQEAGNDVYYTTTRRKALMRLAATVGDGPLPDPVPLYYFNTLR